jgi:tripartite-type tricarboxylate transporter receptor subunit TctC
MRVPVTPFMLRRAAAVAIALGLLAAPPAGAQATNWPNKPVRFVVPFPPGGSNDQLARLLGARLAEITGQTFVVDNRQGASGAIGTAVVAKAPADGYTYLFAFDTHAINPALYRNLPYDTFKDFAPVMLIGTAPQCIAANATRPYKSMADVVRASKAKPDSVSYGSTGNGTLGHLMMMLLQKEGGFKAVHVPYKGFAPMAQDVMGGQLDMGLGTVAVLSPFVASGRLRGLAVSSETRSPAMPGVPTLSEQGFPGFSGLSWWGVFAPTGTPRPVLTKFHAELAKIINAPELKMRLSEQLGMSVVTGSPEVLQKFVVSEAERWGKVVRENQIRAD